MIKNLKSLSMCVTHCGSNNKSPEICGGEQSRHNPWANREALGRTRPGHGENPPVFLATVHVSVRYVLLIVPLEGHGGSVVPPQDFVPLRVRGRIEGNALHVLKVHLVLLRFQRFVLLAVEERDLVEAGVQVLLQHLDDLDEGGAHLRVVLPTHLHQAVPRSGQTRVRGRKKEFHAGKAGTDQDRLPIRPPTTHATPPPRQPSCLLSFQPPYLPVDPDTPFSLFLSRSKTPSNSFNCSQLGFRRKQGCGSHTLSVRARTQSQVTISSFIQF